MPMTLDDWLEERGESDRATFIRLRVALSRQPEEQQDQAQVATADALLSEHRLAWLGPLAELADADAWQFPRGLPSSLGLRSKGLDAVAVSRLASSPHLVRLTTLDLNRNEIGDAGAQALASSPHLARLTTLYMYRNDIGAAGAQALSGSPHLAQLTSLDLGQNGIGDAGAQALAGSPHLAELTRLDLEHNQIGDSAREALRQRFGDRVYF